MPDRATLPGCFGLHRPELPNDCNVCEVRAMCQRVILKAALDPIIKKLEKALEVYQ